jgi:TIR domain
MSCGSSVAMKMFVFVSYAHDDSDEYEAFDLYLKQIEQEIESEENVSLVFWSDQRSDTDYVDLIVAGGDWRRTIQKRIDKSSIFILLASENYFSW